MTKATPRFLMAALACVAALAYGDGGEGPGSSGGASTGDPVIKSAQDAIKVRDWPAAQAILKDALARNPNNADYHNLFAFSTRKGPNPAMAVVFEHYNEALRLDPKHRGAREYMGEAYLAVNDLPKAREQLAALDKLCFFGCEEYSDLKKAVADYEASHKP